MVVHPALGSYAASRCNGLPAARPIDTRGLIGRDPAEQCRQRCDVDQLGATLRAVTEVVLYLAAVHSVQSAEHVRPEQDAYAVVVRGHRTPSRRGRLVMGTVTVRLPSTSAGSLTP